MPLSIVWRTDVHYADKGPSSRKDDWPTTILGKLAQVRDIAKDRDAALILDGGDFFHVKSPTRNSHELIRRAADHHRNYPCPVACTPGNHDAVYGDYAYLGQQPLGVMFSTDVFLRCYDEFEVFVTPSQKKGGERVYLRSNGVWKGEDPFSFFPRPYPIVRIVGVPYHGKLDLERFRSIKKGEEDFLVCSGHILASEKGGAMFEGEDILQYAQLVDTAPDVFCFGHWHKNQGIVEVGGKTIVNIGSLSRGSLSEDEIQRIPACAVLSFSEDGVKAEQVPLQVEPPEVVFDVEGRARQVRRQIAMDVFVQNIRGQLAPAVEGQTLEEAVDQLSDVPLEVRERVLSYLEQVE